jgi:hypothetical protein
MRHFHAIVLSIVFAVVSLSSAQAQSSPGPRDSHDLLYHAALDQVILMHGLFPDQQPTPLSDVWGWDGRQWTLLSNEGPPRRLLSATSYDSARARLVVFGGVGRDDEKLNDTWAWDGTAWRQLATTGPTARAHYSLVYDDAREQVVMFGGIHPSLEPTNDMWVWDGEVWILIPPTDRMPSPRDAARIAFDAATDTLLLFGGRQGQRVLGDTWRWDGEWWQELQPDSAPTPRAFHAMVYDPNRERVILSGG